ncbi:glycosyltransferase family 2 protein [Celeribacter halophilus]|uniref:Glycosyltransferase involved in cell wall bisynthesis n=1 Tax=Celeribacter halophilus TaxID=576117 RepID=A0A1I3VNP3_9RHOB|nr:glycosyltransferase family 2 protein [Celeribacter halophilus]PZX09460.1 glycosyltransferase involved in cell wall biosynthesis [Celeribacter halophilus]SFJ96603.1 Glycosyltransferase involved in cell wall bisynthesis [Celeribacter halophilus]
MGEGLLSGVAVCICTYKRPEMLAACLKSVGRLQRPDDMRSVVIVIDNEDSEQTREIVRAANANSNIPIECHTEKQRGLCFARNAALSQALEWHADQIVFMDDDQTVPPDWLIAMLHAQKVTGAMVIQSSIEFRKVGGTLIKVAQRQWQHDLPQAYSGGVLLASELVRPDGYSLRFDERFNLSGGEDRWFFLQAKAVGAKIVLTPEAIITEHVIDQKDKLSVLFKRRFDAYRVASLQDLEMLGPRETYLRVARFAPLAFYKGISSLILSGIILPFNRRYARKKIRKATSAISESVGAFSGLWGRRLPNSYSTTIGR